MKLKYDDGLIKIYCGDNREYFQKGEKFDLLLTDPPYGIKESSGKNRSRGGKVFGSNVKVSSTKFISKDWDNSICANLVLEWISQANRSIIFGGNYYPLSPNSCWFVWDKLRRNDFADCELLWTNLPGASRIVQYKWDGLLQGDMKNKEHRVHPTQKPVNVILWLLRKAQQILKRDIKNVIDPFCGSGTTLVACKQLGIPAIGIEKELDYCKDAIHRLEFGTIFNKIGKTII